MPRRVSVIALVASATLMCVSLFGQKIPNGPSASALATDSTQRPSDPNPRFQERNPRYHLRKGDSFDVDFALSPEFNRTAVVQPDGFVTLRGAGSLHVEGQTVPELAETIKKAYANILHDPVPTTALNRRSRSHPRSAIQRSTLPLSQ